MAPRLNKRQQREQDELLALGGRASSPNAESSGEDGLDPPVVLPAKAKKPQAGFAAVSGIVVSVCSMILDGKTSLWRQTDLEMMMKMRLARRQRDR